MSVVHVVSWCGWSGCGYAEGVPVSVIVSVVSVVGVLVSVSVSRWCRSW